MSTSSSTACAILGPSFGGINLEDIKAPDCFIIEQRLRELMDIPVFHDDQHGTAIIAAAGLINALASTGRDMKTTKLVCNGAGSAGIACIELIKSMGFSPENVILCDTKGVVYQGRTEGMNQWKSAHAAKTDARTLADAMDGADIVFGLSARGAFTTAMIQSMAKNPIIFAMANPDPEITPEEVAEIRTDAIMATGRSDYPNQVNNVLGFPYIFRGALDVRATTINDAMKVAAARGAGRPRPPGRARRRRRRLPGQPPEIRPELHHPGAVRPAPDLGDPVAVAKAAMDSGVARRPILDLDKYAQELSARRDPIASTLQRIYDRVRRQPKRVVFAEGEEEQVMRAAVSYANQKLGTAILVGREEHHQGERQPCRHRSQQAGHRDHQRPPVAPQRRLCRLSLRAHAAQGLSVPRLPAADQQRPQPFRRLHAGAGRRRRGGHRRHPQLFDRARRHPPRHRRKARPPRHRRVDRARPRPHGASSPTPPSTTCPTPRRSPTSPRRPRASRAAWATSRAWPCSPIRPSAIRAGERSERVQEAVKILDKRRVDFEYDGEMAADVALNAKAMQQYPFCRLSGPANVLVMPAFHSASISTKMLQELGGSTVIGPLLVGLNKPVQIVSLNAKDSDIVNMAAIAAYSAGG